MCLVPLHNLVESQLIDFDAKFLDQEGDEISVTIIFSLHYTKPDFENAQGEGPSDIAIDIDTSRDIIIDKHKLWKDKSATWDPAESIALLGGSPSKRKKIRWKGSKRFLAALKPRSSKSKETASEVESRRSSELETVREDVTESDLESVRTEYSTADLEEVEAFKMKKAMSNLHSESYMRGLKWEDFQVRIAILEAQISGTIVNPVVEISIGRQKKKTNIKHSTNRPVWHEAFTFEFYEPASTFFDKLITIKVFNCKALHRFSLIGDFRLDISTVYSYPHHGFNHKWAPIMDPKNAVSGPRGYVKCSILAGIEADLTSTDPERLITDSPSEKAEMVSEKLMLAGHVGGLPASIPDELKDTMPEDIESNIILPYRQAAKTRQQAHFTVKIHSAEALPTFRSGNMFRKAKDESLTTCVQVSFAGHTGTTNVQKGVNPEYDEMVVFKEMFPPLVQRIKLKVLTHEKQVIGTHYLDLGTISDPGVQGFLPVFGPSYINLYGAPRDSSDLAIEKTLTMNQGHCEGISYRGRLLISLEVQVFEEDKFMAPGVTVLHTKSVSKSVLGRPTDFLLFGCIMNITMLSKKLVEKPLHLEVSIGDHTEIDVLKYERDHKPATEALDMESETDETIPDWHQLYSIHTAPLKPALNDPSTGYLPLGDTKPCLYTWFQWPDHRWRIYNSNVLTKLHLKIETTISDLEYLYSVDRPGAQIKLANILNELPVDYQRYRSYLHSLEEKAEELVMNRLDKERLACCKREMDSIASSVNRLKSGPEKFSEKVEMLQEFAKRLEAIADDPQNTFPDVIVWLMQGAKRVAYYRIPAQDLMQSSSPEERGTMCGKVTKIYLKLPGLVSATEHELWRINGQVTAYFWLGLNKHRIGLLDGLPRGFGSEEFIAESKNPDLPPPKSLEFNEKCEFEMRCHIFQARYLPVTDLSKSSGLIVRCMFQGYSSQTQPINEATSANPVWDETLVMRPVQIYGSAADRFKTSAPTIIVEIFDQGKGDFVGQTIVEPAVKLLDDAYCPPLFPPKLKWLTVKRSMSYAGQLLAAFELLELRPDGRLPTDVPEMAGKTNEFVFECKDMTVPLSIRPKLKQFRLEVFFWGIRNLAQPPEKIRVDIDCGRQVLQSDFITNVSKYPNFPTALKTMDLELPENSDFWPAISIRCVDCRSFGRDKPIGQNVIHDFSKMLCPQTPEDQDGEETIIQLDDAYAITFPAGFSDTTDIVSHMTKKALKQQEELEKFDWWTKYFASMEDKDTKKPFNAKKFKNKIKNQVKEEIKQLTENYSWLRSCPCFQKPKPPLRKVKQKEKSEIAKLKVYPNALEAVEEFDKLKDWVDTFELVSPRPGNRFEEEVIGSFRGTVRICPYPLPSRYANGFFQTSILPSNAPVRVMVRLYIIKAAGLLPADLGGSSDPYIYVKLGKNKISDRENYVANQLNPVFGRSFEMEATFPSDTNLCIQLWDRDAFSADDFLGETTINLEDRFYSKHRASCGLSETFAMSGYNAWRDSLKPTQILAKLCKDNKIEPPLYMPTFVRVGKRTFHWSDLEEIDEDFVNPDELALHALRNWHDVPKVGTRLVPEHVESRMLTHPKKPGIHGRLEMWVDIFPVEILCRSAVNISPRKPKSYELRIEICNTEDVILDEATFVGGESMSDIYVKGSLSGEDTQTTDVHYRSLDGEGNFNWRFIYRFDYLEAEEKVVFTKKEKLYKIDKTQLKLPPVLQFQVMDSDIITRDDFLGSLSLNLVKFPRGFKLSHRCTLERFINMETVNLFEQRRTRGWWPFATEPTDGSVPKLAGRLEAEFELLTAEEADAEPKGLGRNEPHALPEPRRPATSFMWMISPFKSMRYILWSNYRRSCIVCVIILLLILWVAEFIYAFPMYAAERVLL